MRVIMATTTARGLRSNICPPRRRLRRRPPRNIEDLFLPQLAPSQSGPFFIKTRARNVRFASEADITRRLANVRFTLADITRCRKKRLRAKLSRDSVPPVHQAMSALSAKADIDRRDRHVRFVPKADSRTAAKNYAYSITSSARPSSGSGNVRPSALAVFRLITSSTFAACWIGRSAGFSPLRIRPT